MARDLNCTCYRLRRAARGVTAVYDEALAPLGLTITQMNVLAMAGAAGGCRIAELADALGMDASTMSRTLRPLVRRGLLASAEGRDRRTRTVSLTPEGAALEGDAVKLWRSAQRRVEAAIGGEIAALHALLGRVEAGLGESSGT